MPAAAHEVAPVAPPEAPGDRAEALLAAMVAAKGGTHRPGQAAMARAVAERITGEHPLMIQGGTGVGKALCVDTLIPTPDRGFVRMGDLQTGDQVFGAAGAPVAVTAAFPELTERYCYEVAFADGTRLIADADHEWTVVGIGKRRNAPTDPWCDARTVTTTHLHPRSGDTLRYDAIPIAGPLDCPDLDLPVDPYLAGMVLAGRADGRIRLTCNPDGSHPTAEGLIPNGTGEHGVVYLTPDAATQALLDTNSIRPGCAIPAPYLFSGREQRRALLAGILDVAGQLVGRQIQYNKAQGRMVEDVQTLACSLGYRATLAYRRPNGMVLSFTPGEPVFGPGREHRNTLIASSDAPKRPRFRAITSVTPVTSRPVRCITVDAADSLYLAGRTLIPTHNSKAYLAGAFASGVPTVIATHTKALQDQLADDLDSMVEAVTDDVARECGIPRAPTFAIIKGRQSYACLAKLSDNSLAGVDAGPTSGDIGRQVVALREWAATTETGDRADVPFDVDGPAWDQVSVNSDDCAGKGCPFHDTCFAERPRLAAARADLIVTNQALLAMAMRLPLLPEHVGAVVVDEAHSFPSVVTESFGARLTIERLQAAQKSAAPLETVATEEFDTATKAVTAAIAGLRKACPVPPNQDRDLAVSAPVVAALEAVSIAFARYGVLVPRMDASDDTTKARKDMLDRVLANLERDIRTILGGQTDTQVVWVEGLRGGRPIIRAAQFDVAETINALLLQRFRRVVFTSATLTVSGSFEIPAKTAGFTGTPWAWQIVASPFDYDKQGLVWFPQNIPPPGRDTRDAHLAAVADVAEEVVNAAGGRTLVLCTSWRAVETIANALTERLGDTYPILRQEPGRTSKGIAAEFAANPRAVLVGTLTFWTGISFDGDTCAAVVMDAMPFPVPTDPITAARTEKADKAGRGLGFLEVSLASACLTVTQGAGRAIRTVKDRAVIVICDSRIHPTGSARKSYAPKVLASLPPFPHTVDSDVALAMLRKIDVEARARGDHGSVLIVDEPEDEPERS